jgi:hypothetical protein
MNLAVEWTTSLRLDVRRLDDRPPFLDLVWKEASASGVCCSVGGISTARWASR